MAPTPSSCPPAGSVLRYFADGRTTRAPRKPTRTATNMQHNCSKALRKSPEGYCWTYSWGPGTRFWPESAKASHDQRCSAVTLWGQWLSGWVLSFRIKRPLNRFMVYIPYRGHNRIWYMAPILWFIWSLRMRHLFTHP